MQRFLTLAFAALLAFTLTACLEETTTIGAPEVDGFSSPEDMLFSDNEMAILDEVIDINRRIVPAITEIPMHMRRSNGSVVQSESDARKAVLGRVLFYDKQLSATGETSCATCHKQEIAFSDDLAFSKGINGQVTKRNSIALGSVPSFAPSISGYGSSGDQFQRAVTGEVKFFWDERAETIKEQSALTIADELEMGRDIHSLSDELKNQEVYKILTMKAFGTTDLTPDRITLALERFTSTIVSMDTRFDKLANEVRRGGPRSNATDQERRGMDLFTDNCAGCHGNQMGKPRITLANNGLDEVYDDKGMGDRTNLFRDNGVFKVPFLRNVALTGPYMHDGRFETLREVIDHYSEGIANHPNLHINLRTNRASNGSPRRMNFTTQEKQALVAFLEMATDQSVLTNPAYSDPFRP